MAQADLLKIKESVTARCNEIPSSMFDLSAVSGKTVRDRIGELNNYLARYNELYDAASLRYQLQKNTVTDIEAMAVKELLADTTLQTKFSKITSSIIEAYKYSHQTKVGLVLSDENEKLAYFEYAMNRYKGMLKLIQATINSCQSMLAFDRTELGSIGYGT